MAVLPCRLTKEKEYQCKKLFSELIFLIRREIQMKSLPLPGELTKVTTVVTRTGSVIT